LIIIIGVGHNSKAHACLYATRDCRIYISFRRKYVLGGLLTMFATALEINAKSLSNDLLSIDFLIDIIGLFYLL
jgi:hypothetical protein